MTGVFRRRFFPPRQSQVFGGILGGQAPTINVSGALVADAATLDGSVEVVVSIDGSLVAQAAAIDGDVSADLSVSGSLEAGSAETSGDIEVVVQADGGLVSDDATTDGAVSASINAEAELLAAAATIDGEIEAVVNTDGVLLAGPADLSGDVEAIVSIAGSLESESAQADGSVEAVISISSDIYAGSPTMSAGLTLYPFKGSGSDDRRGVPKRKRRRLRRVHDDGRVEEIPWTKPRLPLVLPPQELFDAPLQDGELYLPRPIYPDVDQIAAGIRDAQDESDIAAFLALPLDQPPVIDGEMLTAIMAARDEQDARDIEAALSIL